MPQLNSILTLLGIKDPNVNLISPFVTLEKHKLGEDLITHKVVHAKLDKTTHPKCPSCGGKTIKNGSYTTTIKIPAICEYPALIKMKKTRYMCKLCDTTTSLDSSLVQRNCSISLPLKQAVLLDSTNIKSLKSIANDKFISHSSVTRIVNPIYFARKIRTNYLPKHLMMDEFKLSANTEGAMCYVFADAKTHEIIDILDDRRLENLTRYFHRYPLEVRQKVETITIDMYEPYMSLIKDCFPNAKIIIDRFHVVQHLNRALLKTRLEVMKKFDEKSLEYKLLKKYWRQIQKDPFKLDTSYRFYCRNRRAWTTSFETLEELIEIDPLLTKTHSRIHALTRAFMDRDKEHFFRLLSQDTDGLNQDSIRAIDTLRGYSDYLENSMDYPYSNGPLEGTIRKIKLLSRVSFGFRSFERFRNRFFIINKLVKMTVPQPLTPLGLEAA